VLTIRGPLARYARLLAEWAAQRPQARGLLPVGTGQSPAPSWVSQCANCKQSLSEFEMPPAYRQEVSVFKQRAKLPLSNYFVLGLFGAVVVFSLVASLFK
jgi:hypothetical protein